MENKEEFLEQLRREKQAVQQRVERAAEQYYAEPSGKTMQVVLEELTNATIYNLNLRVLLERRDGLTYALMHHEDVGYCYQACLTPEELSRCPEESSGTASYRDFLEQVASGEQLETEPRISGAILNPCHGSKAVIYVSSLNAQAILRYADHTIRSQTEEVQNILRRL